MNTEQNQVTHSTPDVYIPLVPNKRRRFGLMLANVFPAVAIISTAFSSPMDNTSQILVKVFSILTGVLVIYSSVKSYQKPGPNKLFGADTGFMFTGFMMIAQGGNMFNALKGFQPAHLYFLAGFILIVKGFLFPDSRIKRGFIIHENEVKFKKSLLLSSNTVPANSVIDVQYVESNMVFTYPNNHSEKIRVANVSNGSEMAAALRMELID